MTTNQDRAAEVIYPWIDGNYGDQTESSEAAAQALAGAGLLVPDLPEPEDIDRFPGSKCWQLPHPVRLVTEEDYHNAPKRTVVWGRGESSRMDSALEKYGDVWFESGDDFAVTHSDMELNGPHEILRWGDVS